jgi:hypothetical protein
MSSIIRSIAALRIIHDPVQARKVNKKALRFMRRAFLFMFPVDAGRFILLLPV